MIRNILVLTLALCALAFTARPAAAYPYPANTTTGFQAFGCVAGYAPSNCMNWGLGQNYNILNMGNAQHLLANDIAYPNSRWALTDCRARLGLGPVNMTWNGLSNSYGITPNVMVAHIYAFPVPSTGIRQGCHYWIKVFGTDAAPYVTDAPSVGNTFTF